MWSTTRTILRAPWRTALVAAALSASVDVARADDTPARRVTVRGRRTALEHVERAPTVASSVLRGAAIEGAGASSADVLSRVPGVQITRTGAQSDVATASIRGADAAEIPVYLAGVRLNDDVSGTADLSTIPLWMMERVEVFRGNAPEEADRLGSGGAIFFWPRLPRETRASVGGEIGSFGARAGWASVELGAKRHASLLALRASGAQNDYTFTNDQGQRFDLDERQARRQNADYSQLDAWLVHHHKLGTHARINTVVNAIDREQGVTGLSVVPALHTRASTRRWLLGNSIVVPCDARETCRLELSSGWISATSRLTDPLVELSSLRTRQLDSAGERASHGARLELAPTDALRLSLSSALAIDNIRVDREGTLPRRGQRRSLVPKLGASYHIAEALSVHALAAAECHWTRGVIVRLGRQAFQDSGPCGLLEPVGRVGARYEVGQGLSVLSNVGRYVRMPTLSELYGTAPLVDGNPALLPERGLTLDIGLRGSLGASDAALSFEAFGFWREVDQIVRFRRTAVESLTPFNVAAARVYGLEWAVAADLVSHLRLESAGTLLDPRETTDDPRLDPTVNDILPYTSRLSVASTAELYADQPWPNVDLERLGLRVSYLHRSSRFADAAGQNVLPAQHFLDAELVASLFGGQLLSRFSTRNLLDNQTSDLIGLPVPGRSYHASAEAWF